ncbi:preprotein translocase subunit SecG [Crocinitomicaceae bacterium CZZ-1]|uniref:Protein-export membrane protein SecG n=1 Tax=Taishania pollutisoli TaxID=2766479 RepID=A0A8J6TXB0_9FLAO|nr:preprotein translocase subunit SecG [Taishania pollutisoli]MBC9812266.1 preprotein translocase subunit SecG [Taishania pollutisoli]MBX2950245.1 preprotein translocase subunit SecG [Crocinitomicaceae bacterium]NGF74254.1 preprotein translocase subunit SecG [Fluviicola sp. SGL-29]
MNDLITILIIIASVLLIFIVFIQNPKGGGLSSDFGAAQQIGGVQKTNDFIDKATWSLAGLIAVLSIIMTLRTKSFTQAPPAETNQTEQPANGAQQSGQQGQQGQQAGGTQGQ